VTHCTDGWDRTSRPGARPTAFANDKYTHGIRRNEDISVCTCTHPHPIHILIFPLLLPNHPLRRWAGRNISNTFGAVRQGMGVTSFHRPHHPEFWKMTSANMHAHTYAVHPLIHAYHTTFHILNRPFVLLSFSLCFGVGFSFAILLTPLFCTIVTVLLLASSKPLSIFLSRWTCP